MKVCPKCGSTDVNPLVAGMLGILKCDKCGFQGSLFPDINEEGEEDEEE